MIFQRLHHLSKRAYKTNFHALIYYAPLKIFIALGVVFSIMATEAHGIENTAALNFRHLLQTPSEAAEIDRLRAISQDADGNVWFAGGAGLARFDGLRFKFFHHDSVKENSLANNSVRDLLCDRNGLIWIASDGGIQVFKPESEEFTMVAAQPSGTDKALYETMAIANDENLWLMGQTRLDQINIITRGVTPTLDTSSANSPLYQQKLNSVFVDHERRLWIATDRGEIFVFDTSIHLLKHWQYNKNNLPHVMDMHFMQDKEHNIWFSGRGVGVLKISSQLDEPIEFWADGSKGALPGNEVAGIGQDAEGQIWLAIDHAGLTQLNSSKHEFEVIHSSAFNPMGPTSDQPQRLFVDRSGDLWIEQYPNGIDYLGATSLAISRFRNDPTQSDSLSHSSITSIFEASDHRIWVGTEAGLNLLDAKNNQFAQFLTGAHSAVVTAIAENPLGDLWVGTWADGLYQLNASGETKQHISEKEGLLGAYIWSMLSDANGQLWIGTETMGLAHYNPKTQAFNYFTKDNNNPKSISNNIIWSMLELDADTLLVGTDVGLNVFHKKTQTFERIGADSTYFKSQDIRSLVKLSNGQIWVGTTWGGISILDNRFKPVGHLDLESGLPSNTVTGLAQGSDGSVWAITFAGAANIDPTTQKIVVLTSEQGLAGNYFNRNAISVDQNGSAYLGSADGLSIVKPQSFALDLPQSTAVINRFELLGREVGPNSPKSPLTKSMSFTDSITLNYQDSLVGIGFSSTNLRGGQDLQFRYQLVGFDKNWVTADNDHRALYANLPSGTYLFKVQAGDQQGFWPNSEDTLSISVMPPPWLGLTAKMIYFICAALLLVFAYLFQMLQQKRHHAELILKTKNDFLSIMSHEIRTPLTGVIGMLQIVLKDKKLKPKTKEQLKLGHLNALALLNITNDILNINKITNDGIIIDNANFNLRLMLNTATASYAEIAESKNLLLDLNIAEDVPECVVADSNRIRQVLANLVGNAIKFTKAGNICVYVRKKPSARADDVVLEFSVADTGMGISPEGLTKLFGKFEQVEKSTSRIYGGSGLGLSICKNLVTAMGGSISADSREGSGSVFTFHIPVNTGATDALKIAEEESGRHAYKLNILCAEDFVTNQIIIRQMVEEMGHKIEMVKNGVEVLKTISVYQFDLILMDGRMPIMDGTEASAYIRSGIWEHSIIAQRDIPIIALTANITQADRDGYVAAGMNAIVGKPIIRDELFRAIDAVIKSLLADGIPLSPLIHQNSPTVNARDPNESDKNASFGLAADEEKNSSED